jgi:hypothetical protein
MNYTALLKIEPMPLAWLKQTLSLPEIELSHLPVKLSQRLWVSPAEFLAVTSAPVLAQWALQVSGLWRPALPEPTTRRGPRTVYEDWSVMVVALVQVAWHMGYEEVIDYFRAHAETAQLAGFAEGRVISIGHYWDRRRAIGVLPFWFLFIAFVAQLVCLGVITGTNVILDATTLHAWFRADPEAKWSFPKPWKGSVWGYKVHSLVCRWSQLPVMFLVTSANRQDSPFAITLLTLAAVCLQLPIALVRADAGYFTLPIMLFIRTVLKASFVIDYNLRRQGKRFLATLFFIDQWRFHLRPRTIIERHFAWAKRYFGLEAAHWLGLVAAYQHTALVYCTMLAIALIAHRYQRPELAGSRTRVLALKTLA